MAKVPKHRRIKRATVLIKRSRCIRNIKAVKTPNPIYHKLKVNNHSLARALSQEKQENQLLFSRNVELLAEVQDLVHTCNGRDLVISNILKNSKDMMQMIVNMSSYLTNTISMCQEFVSNQISVQRTSSSSAGRRESIRRVSTKSPARGVVKPMVSGHTITKPTINLSRVNMQRLQNVNLSIIEEGPASPERNPERTDNRCLRTLPERLPLNSLRSEVEEEERVVVNRKTSRFSGGRISSGRYSKRNSGRLSGSGIAGRLSLRGAEYAELIKSPRVALQDVSRYLSNNQTVNIKSLSNNTNSALSNSISIEDTQLSDESSPEHSPQNGTVIPETQESCETSDSELETNNTVKSRKQLSTTASKSGKQSLNKKLFSSRPSRLESENIDPMEGPSWLYSNSSMEADEDSVTKSSTVVQSEERDSETSPVSSISNERRSTYFRIPEVPKNYTKPMVSKLNLTNDLSSSSVNTSRQSNGLNLTSRDIEDEDQTVNIRGRFITQRRGLSSKTHSLNGNSFNDDDDDDDDDDTIMFNIRRPQRSQKESLLEQPERLQYDVNELLQITPLKALMKRNSANNELAPVEVEAEPTVTIQLTQRLPKSSDSAESMGQMPTLKIYQNGISEPPSVMVRAQETGKTSQEKRFSEKSTVRLSSRIELPRITDVLNLSEDSLFQSQLIATPDKQPEKRKRFVPKVIEPLLSATDEIEDEIPQKKKKPKQRKKKLSDKDPSTAKVVLQKLNESHRASSQSEHTSSERKHSDESIASARSSVISRADVSSDSESSTTSYNSKSLSTRPRRLKAPTNLQEPGLNKKLRR